MFILASFIAAELETNAVKGNKVASLIASGMFGVVHKAPNGTLYPGHCLRCHMLIEKSKINLAIISIM